MSDTSINRFLAQGDDAAEAAFTPSPPTPASGPDPLQLFLNTEASPELKYWDGANFTAISGGGTGDVTATGTLTADTVMLGDGTTAITSLPNGSDGEVLTLTAGVPSWEAASGGGDFVLIEQKTPSGVGTVTFSSLGAFTHLEMRYSLRSTESATFSSFGMQFNGDTAGNYDAQSLFAVNSTVGGGQGIGQTTMGLGAVSAATATANVASTGTVNIYDYRGTTFQKGYVAITLRRDSNGSAGTIVNQLAGAWNNTAAITSVTFLLASGNYVAGSKLTLYGLT